ncbi:MAG TPA: sterol desaturase, partial [Gemmatimonadetes bacterium]|nr:sterol desaturase [Gemmatimonadota bacterium]
MIEGAWDTISKSASMVLEYVLSPEKRLFVGYLVSAALIARWVYRRSGQTNTFLSYLFPRRIWLSSSARVDYQLVVLNSFIKVSLLSAFLVYGLHLASWVDGSLTRYFGPSERSLSLTTTLLTYTVLVTVIGDLSVYWVHRLMHRVPMLWAIHQVHHSAETLTPVTQLRLHPLELVISTARSLLVFGALAGLFRYLSDHQIGLMTFLGVNLFSFFFFSLGANLRHSHVRLRYWHPVEHLFISPLQHQI